MSIMNRVHVPTLGTAVLIIVVVLVLYHLAFGRRPARRGGY